MNNRRFSLLMLFFLFVSQISAQEKDSLFYHNHLKWNVLGLTFNNVSMMYERILDDKWSLALGGAYKWGSGLPELMGIGNLLFSSETRGVRGYSLSPALRYYPGISNCGAGTSGFYAGLYGRYSNYRSDMMFAYWTGSEYADVSMDASLRELGIGIQIGYQAIFKGRYTLDVMFAGPRFSFYRVGYNVDSEYAQEFLPYLEDQINERLEWLGEEPIEIPSSNTNGSFNFNYKAFRYAIAVGVMF